MNNKRIKVTLYNRTYKEIDMSDFTCLPEELFANPKEPRTQDFLNKVL